MSDDTASDFAPSGGPPATGDAASAEEGVAELRRRREAGTANLQVEPDPVEPPPTKLSNAEKSELDPKQGAKLVRQLRADEAARAQAYAANADAAVRKVDQLVAGQGPAEQARADAVKAAAAELVKSFRDIKDAADVARLRSEDPTRYARYEHLDGLIRSGIPDQQPGEQPDPDLSVQAEYAKLEAQKQEFEIEKRIATLDPALQHQAQLVKQLGNEVAAAFPEIRTAEDVQRLAATDPQRYALYAQCHQLLANGTQQVYGALQQQYLEGKARYARESAAKDEAWFSMHPEYAKDPSLLQRDQGAAIAAMARAGVPGEDLDDLWTGAKSIPPLPSKSASGPARLRSQPTP